MYFFFYLYLLFISNIFSSSLTLTPRTSIPLYVPHRHLLYVPHRHLLSLPSLATVHQHSSCFLLVSFSFPCSDHPSDPSFLLRNSCRPLYLIVCMFSFIFTAFLSNILCSSPTSTLRTSVLPYLARYLLAVIHHH